MADSENTRPTGGIAPFGYRWLNGMFVIDQKEAPVRKLIYELFLKHKRKKTVANLLNDLGYRTRNDALFSDTTIGRLLRDTTAKGIRIANNKEIEVDPIVETDLWERANRILGSPRQTKQSAHLLSGIAYCECSGRMIVPSGSSKYVCVDCRHKIPIDDLEEIFASQLDILNVELPDIGDSTQSGLFHYWPFLSRKEKRLIVENICEKIVVGRNTIGIEFGSSPHSSKTAAFGQQNETGNETIELRQANDTISSDITEPLLSEAEAANFLGISKMTLLRKRNAGDIGFFRVGFRVLYSKEKHLVRFLSTCEK